MSYIDFFPHDVSPDSLGELYNYVFFTLHVLYPDRTFFYTLLQGGNINGF